MGVVTGMAWAWMVASGSYVSQARSLKERGAPFARRRHGHDAASGSAGLSCHGAISDCRQHPVGQASGRAGARAAPLLRGGCWRRPGGIRHAQCHTSQRTALARSTSPAPPQGRAHRWHTGRSTSSGGSRRGGRSGRRTAACARGGDQHAGSRCQPRPAVDGGRLGLAGGCGAPQHIAEQVWCRAAGHPDIRPPHHLSAGQLPGKRACASGTPAAGGRGPQRPRGAARQRWSRHQRGAGAGRAAAHRGQHAGPLRATRPASHGGGLGLAG